VSVTTINLQKKIPIDSERLIRHAKIALSSVKKSKSDLSIVIVNDRRMRSLNKIYRNNSKTTDVLSFNAEIPLPPGVENPLLGEIVISAPKALIQANERQIDLSDELTNLAIHGICHLLGYDHELGEQESREMKSAEKKIAEAIRRKDHALSAPKAITGKIPEESEQRKSKT